VNNNMDAVVRKQGAWTVWWLVLITCGVYYFVWYSRVNSELAAATRQDRPAWSRWWSQLIPVYGIVGMHNTAKRLNEALASHGSSTRVSPFTFWFWAALWFASHTRYLQRRQNILAEVVVARSLGASAAAVRQHDEAPAARSGPGLRDVGGDAVQGGYRVTGAHHSPLSRRE
jgi:hypothetical protein